MGMMVGQELSVGVSEEQRKFKRFDVYLIVEIKSFDRPRQSSLGIIRDFSYDGFSFEFHAPDFTLQDNIEFTLRYPKGNLSVTFYGDLIWKEQGYTECLIGIKLRTMDQETKNRYIEIISASGNMPLDLESYERETAAVIDKMEEEKPAEEPVAVTESKSQEEEESAGEPFAMPEAESEEEEKSAEEPVAVTESKSQEEEEKPAKEPFAMPEAESEEEEKPAEEPDAVPEAQLEEEEESVEEPIAVTEAKSQEEEEPVTVLRAKSALKMPPKVKRSKSGLYVLVTSLLIVALAVVSYKFLIKPEKSEKKIDQPKVAVTKKIETTTLKQVEKMEEPTVRRYDYTSIYTLQTGSFTERAPAYKQFDMLAKQLNKKELGFLRIEEIGNYYTVRLGKFDDYTSVKRFLSQMAPGLSDAIILNANIEDDRIRKFYK